jgi:RimJ/RimL family protein N-acetyltransferase
MAVVGPGTTRCCGRLVSHIPEDARQFLPDSLASIRNLEDASSWLIQQQEEGTAVLFARLDSVEEMAAILITSEQSESGVERIYIGYLVSPSHRGIGIATELVQGFVQWVGSDTNADLIRAGVDSSHATSRAVLAKSGFVEVGKDENSPDYLKYECRLVR